MFRLAIVVSLALSVSVQAAPRLKNVEYDKPSSVTLTREEAQFVELTNRERVRRNEGALGINATLVLAARKHSREMYEKDYFDHHSPTAALRTPMKRYLDALGYEPDYAYVGENLFWCSKIDVERGQNELMKSPGHRENILNPRFDKIGVGVFISKDGRFWVTEMFLTNRPPEDDNRYASAAK